MQDLGFLPSRWVEKGLGTTGGKVSQCPESYSSASEVAHSGCVTASRDHQAAGGFATRMTLHDPKATYESAIPGYHSGKANKRSHISMAVLSFTSER